MVTRFPLQIVENRLILTAVIECDSLRIRRQIAEFVIDTGSVDSYFSEKEVKRLQIPVKESFPSGKLILEVHDSSKSPFQK